MPDERAWWLRLDGSPQWLHNPRLVRRVRSVAPVMLAVLLCLEVVNIIASPPTDSVLGVLSMLCIGFSVAAFVFVFLALFQHRGHGSRGDVKSG
jgi:hypothetical protein